MFFSIFLLLVLFDLSWSTLSIPFEIMKWKKCFQNVHLIFGSVCGTSKFGRWHHNMHLNIYMGRWSGDEVDLAWHLYLCALSRSAIFQILKLFDLFLFYECTSKQSSGHLWQQAIYAQISKRIKNGITANSKQQQMHCNI